MPTSFKQNLEIFLNLLKTELAECSAHLVLQRSVIVRLCQFNTLLVNPVLKINGLLTSALNSIVTDPHESFRCTEVLSWSEVCSSSCRHGGLLLDEDIQRFVTQDLMADLGSHQLGTKAECAQEAAGLPSRPFVRPDQTIFTSNDGIAGLQAGKEPIFLVSSREYSR